MALYHQVAVIGAGLMGHGIALTLARAGHQVTIYDPSEEMLQSVPERVSESLRLLAISEDEISKTQNNIELCDSIPKAVTNTMFVFEAAPEKLELKQSLFEEIETHVPDDTVLASNTSVIQISKIMENLRHKERAIGTHWWNPPHMIPLVEIIKTRWADQNKAQSMYDLLTKAGKTPVMVEKDVPGFIGNRLQHALWREAISLVENGICTAEAVDDVVKASFGRRLAVLGPLENADLIGIELTQDIHKQVLFDLETTQTPSVMLQELLDNGRSGMMAGAGFRNWSTNDLAKCKSRVAEHLLKLDAILP